MSPLVHVIYASAATVSFDEASLSELLRKARANNARLGVTGMLLYTAGNFMQVLEGPPAAVDEVYRRIAVDPRHGCMVRIAREAIAEREFDEWTMGFESPTPEALAALDGRNDFFEGSRCFRALDDGRAKRLLAAFRRGAWRTSPGVSAGRSPGRSPGRGSVPVGDHG